MRKKKNKTDDDIQIDEDPMLCLVHRGNISGEVYVCPKCKSFYCKKCASVLMVKGEQCWSCGKEIEIELSVGQKKVLEQKLEDAQKSVRRMEGEDEDPIKKKGGIIESLNQIAREEGKELTPREGLQMNVVVMRALEALDENNFVLARNFFNNAVDLASEGNQEQVIEEAGKIIDIIDKKITQEAKEKKSPFGSKSESDIFNEYIFQDLKRFGIEDDDPLLLRSSRESFSDNKFQFHKICPDCGAENLVPANRDEEVMCSRCGRVL